MKVLLLENDEYAKKLAASLGSKTDMQVSICTDIDVCRRMVKEGGFQIVLIDEAYDYADPAEFEGKQTAVAFISGVRDKIKDTLTIYKYSNIRDINNLLMKLYADHTQHEVNQGNGESDDKLITEVITFLPVSGGSGSSTVSMAAALKFAENSKVLYLNFEQCHSEGLVFPNEKSKSVSEVIAMFQTKFNLKDAKLLLDSVIQNCKNGPDYINGFSSAADAENIPADIIKPFVDVIRKNYDYRYVIIDADFTAGAFLRKLIQNSDRLVFTSTGSEIANDKIKSVHRYLEIIGRESDVPMPDKFLVFNQYYGLRNEDIVARDMRVVGRFGRYRSSANSLLSADGVVHQMLSEENFLTGLRR